MKNSIEQLKKEFAAINLMKLFEIPVFDNKTGELEYLSFDISIDGDSLRAEHIALNEDEEKSDKMAFKSIELGDCFSLDENLQSLYDECLDAVFASDYFTLS
jgi:hypothetical protein